MICPICGKKLTPYYNAAEGMKLRGWLCPSLHYSEKAIGRERKIIKGEEHDRPGAGRIPGPVEQY